MKLFDRLRLGLYGVMFAALALTCGAILTTPADAAPPDIGIGCTYTDAGTAQTKACIGIYAGGGTDSNGLNVQGNSGAGVADTGMPVKVGGVFAATPTLLTDGQRGNLWIGNRGQTMVASAAVLVSPTGSLGNAVAGIQDSAGNARMLGSANFDGTNFYATRGDTNGTYVQFADASGNRALTAAPTTDGLSTLRGVATTSYGIVYDSASSSWSRQRGNAEGTAVLEGATASLTYAPLSIATTAVAADLLVKAAPGNLYGFLITSGASAGFLLINNSAALPASGAVTPSKCFVIAANSTVAMAFAQPIPFTAGISMSFSTTGCFAKTPSSTAFISAEYK